jgi:hypothetical protein
MGEYIFRGAYFLQFQGMGGGGGGGHGGSMFHHFSPQKVKKKNRINLISCNWGNFRGCFDRSN